MQSLGRTFRIIETCVASDQIVIDAVNSKSGTDSARPPLAGSQIRIIWTPCCVARSGGRGSFQVGQTAKARSGCRVQSLRKGRDRQVQRHNLVLSKFSLPKIVRIALLMDLANRAQSNQKGPGV